MFLLRFMLCYVILIPALKKGRGTEGTKAAIIGDRLLVNERNMFDKIPKKWQSNVEASHIVHGD